MTTIQTDQAARPDILEKLTYHRHERDDMTLDDCLEYLANRWKKIPGRPERALIMQITELLAATPQQEVAASSEPVEQVQVYMNRGRKCWEISGTVPDDTLLRPGLNTLYSVPVDQPVQAKALKDLTPAQDEYEAFAEWYEKEAPVEGEVSEIDMARHGWLAGRRYASTNQPVQAKALTDERAAFEQWCVRKGYSTNKWHGDGSVYVDGYTLSCWEAWQARALLASQPSAQADVAAVRDAALEEGIEKAAKLIEQKVQDYVDDHGIYDRDTGAVEFPGDGEIYVGEMTELAEDIRALKSAAPTAQPQADGVKP
ncbi:hypothetical protein [Herminiimonas contaminans]|uniref:Uncharacterized protein n=1 Tax=Herminiimonas contaminans TaxID=1111140 RepID=A0ABS0ERP1_9BURK|nr:hypothetical protein [Herminiimonas contaminans]MBF8177213.1 hypothetical protein [Herminiimonas contaminans]